MAISQNWRTPKYIFAPLNDVYRYDVDLAAEEGNSLCADFCDEEYNALAHPWDAILKGRTWWCNPPYDDILPWVERAVETRCPGSMLIPGSFQTEWFKLAQRHAVREDYDGRIKFVPSPEMEVHWEELRKAAPDEKARAKIGKASPKQPNTVFHFNTGVCPYYNGYRSAKTGLLMPELGPVWPRK